MTNGQYVNFDLQGVFVEVIDETTFIASFSGWNWDASFVVQEIVAGDQGTVNIRVYAGVSLEHQIELANTLMIDPWFCVPHLATDDYVTQMASLIHDTLDPTLKAHIEYSNEIWNWAPGFWQTWYAFKMATAEGDTTPDRHLRWGARRSSQVFAIFDQVYGSAEREARVVRVIGAQGRGGSVQLSVAGPDGADALAIAPYFGAGLNNRVASLPEWQNTSLDVILDMAREDIVSESWQSLRSSSDIAVSYSVQLLAYEGGQHMGGSGWCSVQGMDCSDLPELQALFQEANRHPRMKGLYRNLLKAWSLNGGGAFAAYNHIGTDSKWGSWSHLQYQDEDLSTAWKWQALVENIGFE